MTRATCLFETTFPKKDFTPPNAEMDSVLLSSASAIETLQLRFPQQKDLFFMISNFFDPRYAFLIYAPLLYAFDKSSGKKLMWVTVLAEWSNQILKWMLHGDRPYWWVHETGVYNRTGVTMPAIQQYFMTCETGPGSPSGHSMVSAAVWYILIEAFLKKTGALNKNTHNLLSSACWSVYAFMVFFVSVSRVYIAAHFPHQCALGIVIGFGVAKHSYKIMSFLDRLTVRHYVLTTAGLLTSASGTFLVLRSLGMNPMWSVDRAVKWCARLEYVHMDTTPFFSMMRYGGFLLGMGFGFGSSLQRAAEKVTFSPSMRVLTAVLCVALAKLSEKVDFPKGNTNLLYGLVFLLNSLLPYAFIAVVPFLVAKVWPQTRKSKVA